MLWHSWCYVCNRGRIAFSWKDILWDCYVHHINLHEAYWQINGKITEWRVNKYPTMSAYYLPINSRDNFFRMVNGDRT
jgi:hypothetical protein